MRPRSTRTLLAALLAAQLAVAPGHANFDDLPDLGDESAAVLPPHEERKLGETFMRNARRNLAFVDDAESREYIQSLGDHLVAASGDTGIDFRFFIINDAKLNAFAVPGGFIGINSGMIQAARTEAELAAVMAHEIAHVQQRHIPRLIAQSQRLSAPALGAVLAAIILASASPEAAEAAIAMTTAGMAQHGLNFTRGFEQEADRIGIRILAAAGFSPDAMALTFERLQSWGRLNDTNLPEFLRTHPISVNRIAEARARAERLRAGPGRDSAAFYHARARLRVLTSTTPRQEVEHFTQAIAEGEGGDTDALHYGRALALLRTNQFEAARSAIAGLRKRHPQNLAYRLAQADVEIAAGEHDRGLRLYAQARETRPGSRTVLQRYAGALLEAGRHERAYKLLRSVVKRDDDPILHKLLAQAAGNAGALFEAHQAMAEYYYASGNFPAALEQLHIARRFAGDSFYANASIDARTKEVREAQALWSPRP